MVEFGDLQCPVCKAYSQAVLPTIVDKYVRTGKVRLELRLISIIGPDSPKAAAMALAAGQQDQMWNYAEVFYVNQGQENSGYVTPDFLRRIGSGVPGLNVDQAMSARDGAKVQQQMADATRLAQINGINATPSFLLGPTGGTLRNFNVTRLDPKQFSQGIDAALKKA
jgi:protein-disulfide isomerase